MVAVDAVVACYHQSPVSMDPGVRRDDELAGACLMNTSAKAI